MNELIKINYDSDRPTVSARVLHEFLEVETRYNDWFNRMTEYGFSEGTDFYSILSKTSEQGGRPATDHQLTIDMAKELCMIQRNEKGKQARQYFLEVEKQWNSPEAVMSRALKMANQKLSSIQSDFKALQAENTTMKPKALFADSVAASSTSILVRDLAKLLKKNGVDIGEKRLWKWMRDNGYAIKADGRDHNMPTQKSMDLGVMETKENTNISADGESHINKTTLVTGKGQIYFVNKFLEELKKLRGDLP